jgi:hypothetical protein
MERAYWEGQACDSDLRQALEEVGRRLGFGARICLLELGIYSRSFIQINIDLSFHQQLFHAN